MCIRDRELLALFASKQPPEAPIEKEAWAKAFFAPEEKGQAPVVGEQEAEFNALNEELKLKTFLNGDGLEHGARDDEIYAKIGSATIDSGRFPNLYRWQRLLGKVKGSV
eukprot:TRINITY_DN0_c1617_g1_i1.p1 TRINITY_DN0_c1617_g1~~TRINITY_DN0_c1617_g1_i1.p1  ORF type:complete len:109 (-),score=42.28 TRINITY_DN0_c1617_g1_i1:28-354(-)